MTTAKPLPRRTCVACRQVKSKREMLRIVKTPEGNIELDVAGKKEGRGAYICTNKDCWEKAKKDKHLEHALKVNISQDSYKKIFENGTEFLKESGSA